MTILIALENSLDISVKLPKLENNLIWFFLIRMTRVRIY